MSKYFGIHPALVSVDSTTVHPDKTLTVKLRISVLVNGTDAVAYTKHFGSLHPNPTGCLVREPGLEGEPKFNLRKFHLRMNAPEVGSDVLISNHQLGHRGEVGAVKDIRDGECQVQFGAETKWYNADDVSKIKRTKIPVRKAMPCNAVHSSAIQGGGGQ